jgi:TonB family protein
MFRFLVVAIGATALAFAVSACNRRTPAPDNPADDLAAQVLNARVKALKENGFDPSSEEVEKRLATLFGNPDKEADEAGVILMSFYLGEHNGEELYENLVNRGPRIIPLLEHYTQQEPTSLLQQYPMRMRLERKTTELLLREILEILKVQAGARRISGQSVETVPLRQLAGNCQLRTVKHPEPKFGDNLIQAGESYRGSPVLRVDIEENGDVTNVEVIQPSGIRRLDALLLANVRQWKYGPRSNCGVVQSNIAITIDWIAAN